MNNSDVVRVSLQQQRIVHIKLNLLDFNFNVIDELSGEAISFPTVTIDANSDIRRTCHVELCATDSSFNIEQGSKIWLDKYIQLYIGIEYMNDIVWMNQGIYLINQPSLTYNSTTNTLTFDGVDLMSKLTGTRNGYMEGATYSIPVDSDIEGVIIETLKLGGFTNYIINIPENQSTVPNELKFDIGATLYDIISTLRDLYGSYQTYFDVNGVFHYEKISSNMEEIAVANDILQELTISATESVDFESVKNVVEVYGKTHDVTYYSNNTTWNSNQRMLTAKISGIKKLSDNMIIGLTTPEDLIKTSNNQSIIFQLNSFTSSPIVNDYGEFVTELPSDKYLVFRYTTKFSNGKWQYLGHLQSKGYAEDDNPNSSFYCYGSVGKIRKICVGGEYDNIYSDILAQERAEYELYLSARINDTITIECVPLYYLDVHQLIEFTLPNTNKTEIYCIQSININDTQTITASRFYEE